MKKIIETLLHYQTLYVVWGNMILFAGLLYSLPWSWWLPISLIASYYVCTAISEITVHRYFSHKSYEVSDFGEKVLLFLALFVVLVERKFLAYAQRRMGPAVMGRNGALQIALDLIKLLTKEIFLIPRPSSALAPLFLALLYAFQLMFSQNFI
jgi:hypothetical protein